jgi:hypothetical protein
VKKSSRIVRRPRRYRRSRHLVCHWTQDGLAIANYATGLQTVGSALTAEVLDSCGDWLTLDEIGARLPHMSRASLAAAVRILEQCTLLESADAPRAAERAHEPWASWNPAAGFFHFSTKDVPFGRDHELGEREFREHVKTHPRSCDAAAPRSSRSRPAPAPVSSALSWKRGAPGGGSDAVRSTCRPWARSST